MNCATTNAFFVNYTDYVECKRHNKLRMVNVPNQRYECHLGIPRMTFTLNGFFVNYKIIIQKWYNFIEGFF